MEYIHIELGKAWYLTGDNVQLAIEKLIELLIEKNVSNPPHNFILECNLSDNDTGTSIVSNKNDIYQLRLSKYRQSGRWQVIYMSMDNNTEYSAGSTAPQP